MCEEKNIGMITEQGDLGLGYNPITKDEERVIQENKEIQEEENKENK